jgi:hypothetical protein
MADLGRVIADIAALPGDWHDSGTLPADVIHRIAKLVEERFPNGLSASAETGCGKSTLLLSHLSRRHICFTQSIGNSANKVKTHPAFNSGSVEFIHGPSQLTLRQHQWRQRLDFALLDGAHGYPFPELDYYFIYPQLSEGAILAVDDIHIPTITNLYHFLCEDEMYQLVALETYTAFFVRTGAPVFDPVGDGWFRQKYNQARFPHKEQLVPVLGEHWWLK